MSVYLLVCSNRTFAIVGLKYFTLCLVGVSWRYLSGLQACVRLQFLGIGVYGIDSVHVIRLGAFGEMIDANTEM